MLLTAAFSCPRAPGRKNSYYVINARRFAALAGVPFSLELRDFGVDA